MSSNPGRATLQKAKLDFSEVRVQFTWGVICAAVVQALVFATSFPHLYPTLLPSALLTFGSAILVGLIALELTGRLGNRMGAACAIWAAALFVANPGDLTLIKFTPNFFLVPAIFFLGAGFAALRFLSLREFSLYRLACFFLVIAAAAILKLDLPYDELPAAGMNRALVLSADPSGVSSLSELGMVISVIYSAVAALALMPALFSAINWRVVCTISVLSALVWCPYFVQPPIDPAVIFLSRAALSIALPYACFASGIVSSGLARRIYAVLGTLLLTSFFVASIIADASK